MADKSSHIYEIIRRLSNHVDEAISVLNTDKYVFADSRGHAEEAVEMNMRTPSRLLDDEHKEDNPPLPAAQEVDFSEYMWMGEELEEFDRQVEEELWEQELIEACFEDMLEEEEIHWFFSQLPHNPYCTALPPLVLSDALLSSRLNPEAPEFVPKAAELVAKGPAKSVM